MRPSTYEIHVLGRLPAEELAEFVGLTATYDGPGTVLRGVVVDQAALVGIVARVEALGCSVTELELVDPQPGSGSHRNQTPAS